jgi:hypothetical protein
LITAGLVCRVSQNAKHWQPHSSDHTLRAYSGLLHKLVRAVLLTVEGHPSGYRFPLTDESKTAAHEFLICVDGGLDEQTCINALHKLVYPFFSAREESGEYSKWDEVLECFLAILFLKQDGNFEDPCNVTQGFAICKYLCRSSTLFEALAQAEARSANAHK